MCLYMCMLKYSYVGVAMLVCVCAYAGAFESICIYLFILKSITFVQELVQSSTNITFMLTSHCHQSQSPKFCKLSVTSKPTLAEQPLISCCGHFKKH